MKNKVISIILYSLSILLIQLYFYIEFLSKNTYSPIIRILLLLLVVVLTYFGAYFGKKYNNKYKNTFYRLNLIIWFILYVIFLLKITLLDSYYFRNGFLLVKWNKVVLYDYYYNVVNLIPFRMIIKLFIEYFDGDLSLTLLIQNIIGNFVVCMPFAFFLPRLLKKENNLKVFSITMFVIVSVIELTQFLTLSGTFDVDDYLLNISGAIIMFKLLHNNKINNMIEQLLNM